MEHDGFGKCVARQRLSGVCDELVSLGVARIIRDDSPCEGDSRLF
jgi:hypothetical protein